jgi:hypothetical protein
MEPPVPPVALLPPVPPAPLPPLSLHPKAENIANTVNSPIAQIDL